jgi:hypothetical protein
MKIDNKTLVLETGAGPALLGVDTTFAMRLTALRKSPTENTKGINACEWFLLFMGVGEIHSEGMKVNFGQIVGV